MTKLKLAALAAALLLSACAEKEVSMAPPPRTPYQSIVINTPGVTGANCVMQSGNDTYSVKAPGSVMVRRAPDTMSIACFKGDHMAGRNTVRPSFAPSEAAEVKGTHAACVSCAYPNTVTVAMSLNGSAMDVPVTIWPQ
jgi:hypothetical protein